MEVIIVLFSFLIIAAAWSNPGSSYHYECNSNTGQYKCTSKRCTKTLDGTSNCITSVSIPTNTAAQLKYTRTSYKYSCNWVKCTHIRCTHYFDGQKNCTTSLTTPSTLVAPNAKSQNQ
ncbi:uncharacterized protein Dere_GG27058 [Drosophila erecta]|uniref:Seminal fluid protein n=1 Tax=Drosophila erecta TaxID=7220 RepID=A0A0Q5W9J4_DROER|nr:uncharacterized protein Dere_GG27058 [Drosophila erecta]